MNLQFFGGRGGGGSGGSRGSRAGGGSMEAPKHVGREEVNKWLDSQRPGDFLQDAPETITVGGVEFNWMGDSKQRNSKSEVQYVNTYQSSIQATNGEWPVIETVVTQKRRGRSTRFEFDRRPVLGSGLK